MIVTINEKMKPVTYAMLMVIIGFSCTKDHEVTAYLLKEAFKKDSLIVSMLHRTIDEEIQNAHVTLSEYSKVTFYSIAVKMGEIEGKFSNLKREAEILKQKKSNENGKAQLMKLTIATFDSVFHGMNEFLKTHGEDFGLLPHEISLRLEQLEYNLYTQKNEAVESLNKSDDNKLLNGLLLQDFIWKIQHTTHDLIQELKQYYGGRTLICSSEPYQLVVSADKQILKKNEPFEAQVYLAEKVNLNPKNLVITINGDTMKLNEFGFLNIQLSTPTTGIQTLNISSVVTNPLTGEEFSTNEQYEYVVTSE